MNADLVAATQELKAHGWNVGPQTRVSRLSEVIINRYAWIPDDVQDFILEVGQCSNRDDTAWFLTDADYSGRSDSSFAWNEWEKQSLSAAKGDPVWEDSIRSFWDGHFPICLSVKSGYAFFALRRSDHIVVRGEEPEFEEVSEATGSFLDLLKTIVSDDGKFARWL